MEGGGGEMAIVTEGAIEKKDLSEGWEVAMTTTYTASCQSCYIAVQERGDE